MCVCTMYACVVLGVRQLSFGGVHCVFCVYSLTSIGTVWRSAFIHALLASGKSLTRSGPSVGR